MFNYNFVTQSINSYLRLSIDPIGSHYKSLIHFCAPISQFKDGFQKPRFCFKIIQPNLFQRNESPLLAMVMSSRFCASFDGPTIPSFVHTKLRPAEIEENIVFSVEYWQPFIDQHGNGSATICGPLLGILLELANQIAAK